MELVGKRSSISSMIAASVLVTLITLSTLTIGIATPVAAQQQGGTPGAPSLSSAACGQVVSGVVNLTANLNCSSGDGIIVGGPNTVINMNGFSIIGPGQDSSKVGIMVPNVDNVVVNGPGSISNFLAGITFVNTQQSSVGMNNIVGSQNGVFLDGQSKQNTISANNVLENVIDLNNANGLPTNINANQYVDNSCETSNPSGLCIGR